MFSDNGNILFPSFPLAGLIFPFLTDFPLFALSPPPFSTLDLIFLYMLSGYTWTITSWKMMQSFYPEMMSLNQAQWERGSLSHSTYLSGRKSEFKFYFKTTEPHRLSSSLTSAYLLCSLVLPHPFDGIPQYSSGTSATLKVIQLCVQWTEATFSNTHIHSFWGKKSYSQVNFRGVLSFAGW